MGVQRCWGMLPWQPILWLKLLLTINWLCVNDNDWAIGCWGGLSGWPTECRYCWYLHLRDVAMATTFWLSIYGVHIGATEPCMCVGDAALCQITLTTCWTLICWEIFAHHKFHFTNYGWLNIFEINILLMEEKIHENVYSLAVCHMSEHDTTEHAW